MSVFLFMYALVGSGVFAAVSITRSRSGEKVGAFDYVLAVLWPAGLGVLLMFCIDLADDKLRGK